MSWSILHAVYNTFFQVKNSQDEEEFSNHIKNNSVVELLSDCGYTSEISISKFAEKDQLLRMIARHKVIYKLRSALEQFKEGLSTLGILDLMQQYPAELETVFCYQGNVLSATVLDQILTPVMVPLGNNRRDKQKLIKMHWMDYLQETEGENYSHV